LIFRQSQKTVQKTWTRKKGHGGWQKPVQIKKGGFKMKLGIDVGYNEVKSVFTLNGAKQQGRNRFPSVVGTPEQGRFGIDAVESTVIAVDGETYLVGESAIVQSQFVHQSEDRAWFLEPQYKVLVANALALATTATSATFDVCTGLPLAYYADREALRRTIGGEYVVKLGDRPEQRLTVNYEEGEYPLVIGQPFGTLLSEALDNSGQLVNEGLAEAVAVLDIGGHTTNILACKGLTEVAKDSTSIDRGGWDLVRVMTSHIDKRCPGLDLLPHEVAKAIVNRRIMYGPETVDLTEQVAAMAAPLAEEVVTRATQFLGSGNNYRQILITGGGAFLLGDAIRARESYSHARVVTDPVFGNVDGYWKLLQRSVV
jgi:PRTRC genetic system protein D